MSTPDGAWRVEAVRRGRSCWYRIVHDEQVIDWLSIAAVHRILAEAGVDLADLNEAAWEPMTPPTAIGGVSWESPVRR